MKCRVCGGAALVHDVRDIPYTYKGERIAISQVFTSGEIAARLAPSAF